MNAEKAVNGHTATPGTSDASNSIHGPIIGVLGAMEAPTGSPASEKLAKTVSRPSGRRQTLSDRLEPRDEVQLIRGDAIEAVAVDWLWSGYLARGKVHILAGAPGTGKTTIALALAAAVTAGGFFPDGSAAPRGNVVTWSGEDDVADTLKPRLIAAGGDDTQWHAVSKVTERGQGRAFDPATDIQQLEAAIRLIGRVSLVILDPIVSAILGDSHKNVEVRRALQPIVDMANRIGCAVLGISHFSKGTAGRDPTERVTGSVAFSAVARIVLATSRVESAKGRFARILVRAKSNIGPDGGGFEYDTEQVRVGDGAIMATKIVWGSSLEGSARRLLAVAETFDDTDQTALQDATAWLSDQLKSGPLPAAELRVRAKEVGIAWRTVERAKSAIRARSRKVGFPGTWQWILTPLVAGPAEDTSPKTANASQDRHTAECDDLGGLGGL